MSLSVRLTWMTFLHPQLSSTPYLILCLFILALAHVHPTDAFKVTIDILRTVEKDTTIYREILKLSLKKD